MQLLDLMDQEWAVLDSHPGAGATAASVAFGDGEAHVRVLRLEPGGEIGLHEAGLSQLFVPIAGAGWVREGDVQLSVRPGEAVYLSRGAIHAKGTADGMTALVIQVEDLQPGGEV